MNIGSNNKYPAGALSNFSGHRFTIDGIICNSMEGFLQSLKFSSIEMQEHICSLVGYGAKKAGRGKNWQRTQTLYWKGRAIKRDSEAYQILLNRAYNKLYQDSESFRKALTASGNAVLKHSIGRNKTNETVLTVKEFCGRLTHLRDKGYLPTHSALI